MSVYEQQDELEIRVAVEQLDADARFKAANVLADVVAGGPLTPGLQRAAVEALETMADADRARRAHARIVAG